MEQINHTIRIVRSAFGAIFASPLMTARVTLVPLLMLLVGQALIEAGPAPDWVILVGPFLLLTLGMTALAILWHRHVLHSGSARFPVSVGLMYCVPALLISLVFVLCLALGVLVPIWVEALSWSRAPSMQVDVPVLLGLFENAFAYIMYGVGTYLALRFSPALPAAALGQPWSLRAAWQQTRTMRGVVLVLTLVQLGIAEILAQGQIAMFPAQPPAVLAGIFLWFESLVGVSLITALYAHLRTQDAPSIHSR